jgi:hypothetical protein
MERDFRKGHLDIDFTTEPFDAIGPLLLRSTRLFFSTLPFLAAVTIAIMVPAKFLLQFVLMLFNVPAEGLLAYFVMDAGDMVFGTLVAPAVIYGLVMRLRAGRPEGLPRTGEALRWGRRLWGKSLWNRFKVEITIALWSLLLFIPGIIAMIKLIFTDPIVAIEADRTTDVLERSREISAGHRWKIFLALLPALPINLIHMYATFRSLQVSPWLMPAVDGVFAVAEQWMTVVVVMIYLGLR